MGRMRDFARRLRVEELEERRLLSVTVDLASRAEWLIEGAGGSSGGSDTKISGDGRYVVFASNAPNLTNIPLPGDEDDHLYRFDRQTGAIELVTFDIHNQGVADGRSQILAVSDDGNVVLFESRATNLSSLDTDDDTDLYARDMTTGVTQLVNVNGAGTAKVELPYYVSLRGDGRLVVFSSYSNALHPLDNNSLIDVFARNLQTGAIDLISINKTGTASSGGLGGVVNGDGSVIAFVSAAADIHPLDTQMAGSDVYARNMLTGVVELISVNAAGTGGSNARAENISLSWDGRFVSFESEATNLHVGDTSNDEDAFVRDRQAGVTRFATAGTGNSIQGSQISANGNVVVFSRDSKFFVSDLASGTIQLIDGVNSWVGEQLSLSEDGNLITFQTTTQLASSPPPVGNGSKVYVFNRLTSTVTLLAEETYSVFSPAGSMAPQMSRDGSFVVFGSNVMSVGGVSAIGSQSLFEYNIASGGHTLLTRAAAGLESATPNHESTLNPGAVSADGRYTVFTSKAENLVTGYQLKAGATNVYRHDRLTGEVELVSVNEDGDGDLNGWSDVARISADGNVVLFGWTGSAPSISETFKYRRLMARNMTANTTHEVGSSDDAESVSLSADGSRIAYASNSGQIYVWDAATEEELLASVNLAGTGDANRSAYDPVISANGNVVVFVSDASNLHPLDTYDPSNPLNHRPNGGTDVFARDLDAGVTHLVSINMSGTSAGYLSSGSPAVSADGTVVAFVSYATDLHPWSAIPNSVYLNQDVYVRNLQTGVTQLASADYFGGASGNSDSTRPSISADGSRVAFQSQSTNLHLMDSNDVTDVFVFEVATEELQWISADVTAKGSENGAGESFEPVISGDGNVVVFTSESGDGTQVLAYQLLTDETRLVSVNATRTGPGRGESRTPVVSHDGTVVAFMSEAYNLVEKDFNARQDVFVAEIDWEVPALVGDFNLDGAVDAADYSVWRNALGRTGGTPYAGADGDGDGDVDGDDRAVWIEHFGETLPLSKQTFVVDTLVDESDGIVTPGHRSLREAIQAANVRPGIDGIEFAASLFASGPAKILLALGELTITDDLLILGPGDELLAIDARQQSRVLKVSMESGNVAITGLTITNGRTTGSGEYYGDRTFSGGGIGSFTIGALLIEDCTIGHHRTTGDYASAGAIYSAGNLVLVNSRVTESGTDGLASYGGGIFAQRPLLMIDSVVSGNDARGEYAGGGGINAPNGASIYGSVISNNHVRYGGGGGITADDLVVRNSIISGNWSEGQGAEGGGVETWGQLSLYDSVVSGNFTLGAGSTGGGIYAEGPAKIVRSEVSHNRTFGYYGRGGGIDGRSVAIQDSTIVGNSTAGSKAGGGGIHAEQLTIERSTIRDNFTTGDQAKGGGIYSRNSVILKDSTLSGNFTIGSDAPGGGMWVYRNVTVSQSTISGNRTSGVNSHGGGVFVPQAGTSSFAHSTITNNRAQNASGGGAWIGVNQLTLSHSIVSGNNAAVSHPDLRGAPSGVQARYSLVGVGTGNVFTVTTGSLIGTTDEPIDARLGALADYGGEAFTHALLIGSPAINAGDPAALAGSGGIPASDQRGLPFGRVEGGRVDMGAFELGVMAGGGSAALGRESEVGRLSVESTLPPAEPGAGGRVQVVGLRAEIGNQPPALPGVWWTDHRVTRGETAEDIGRDVLQRQLIQRAAAVVDRALFAWLAEARRERGGTTDAIDVRCGWIGDEDGNVLAELLESLDAAELAGV